MPKILFRDFIVSIIDLNINSCPRNAGKINFLPSRAGDKTKRGRKSEFSDIRACQY